MIIKNFELNSQNLEKTNFFLFYGQNEGHKKEIIDKIIDFKNVKKITYFEDEIINNLENFYNSLLTKSFFEEQKTIIIKKTTDRFYEIIVNILERNLDGITLILNSEELSKRSKLRIFFEKNKETICTPFYQDNYKSLNIIAINYFKKKNIKISNELINMIIDKANNNREFLNIELEKISNFLINNKKFDQNEILKLINLNENYSLAELIDTCLSKNKKKFNKIINENNFSQEEAIIIIRVFLYKAKRLYKIKNNLELEKNFDIVISKFKPPIFWKDKDIIKEQIKLWSLKNIRELIIEISDTELLIKKNFSNSLNILLDFLQQKLKLVSN